MYNIFNIIVDGGWKVRCLVILSMVESEVGCRIFVFFVLISDVWIFLVSDVWVFLIELLFVLEIGDVKVIVYLL